MSDDLISREDTKQAIRHKFKTLAERCEINEVLNSMPSVQPKRETGQWIDNTVAFYRECSECGALVTNRMEKIFLHLEGKKLNYCPNCGAKMEVKENAET